MAKQKSKPVRWAEACDKAAEAIGEIMSIQEEYQDWLDSLPENLECSPVAEKLQEVCDVDFENLQSEIEVAAGMDLPLGFGRD